MESRRRQFDLLDQDVVAAAAVVLQRPLVAAGFLALDADVVVVVVARAQVHRIAIVVVGLLLLLLRCQLLLVLVYQGCQRVQIR